MNTAEVPTGDAVRGRCALAGPAPSVDIINSLHAQRPQSFLDASRIAEGLFASHLAVNIFLLGAAYQGGLIPISRDRDRGGDPAEQSGCRAQRAGVPLGPQVLSRRGAVESILAPPAATADDRPLVERRVADLARYQNAAYAERYARVRARSGSPPAGARRSRGAQSLQADGLQRRIRSRAPADQPEREAQIRGMWEQVESIGYNLHPPLLRAMGLKKKMNLGGWFRGPLRVLASLKGLRGTPFDPFGYAAGAPRRARPHRLVRTAGARLPGSRDARQPAPGARNRRAARPDSRL